MKNEAFNSVEAYRDERGNAPYLKWLRDLKDESARNEIITRVNRMRFGLFGDVRPIGGGLSELRVHHGPGYRVYYGRQGKWIYLLLCGGDKSTQSKDIERAKTYWQDHKRRVKS